ncbi:hypothetical protein [Exiguobacterium mexicanum]|uniref:hypothetical protein n=1 Tax=Exiguobacterium mexicanum TaxID=340146 RepID=UPI00110F4546|nr:hypothetical protein [Exiguobacterium mexicanum]
MLWNGLSLQVICDQNNSYELEAFQNDIAYCRVVRKWVRKKYKFYVQIVFKGIPPAKRNKETGHFKRTTGSGDVGLDIGLSTLAIVSEKKVKLLVLADRVRSFESEKRLLLRKMDRSRRAMNPSYFNPDGTVESIRNKEWQKSKHYLSYQGKLREIYRKQAAVRKYQHECLANEIVAMGDKIYVETMNFETVTEDASGRTIEYSRSYFRGDKTSFVIERSYS